MFNINKFILLLMLLEIRKMLSCCNNQSTEGKLLEPMCNFYLTK